MDQDTSVVSCCIRVINVTIFTPIFFSINTSLVCVCVCVWRLFACKCVSSGLKLKTLKCCVVLERSAQKFLQKKKEKKKGISKHGSNASVTLYFPAPLKIASTNNI